MASQRQGGANAHPCPPPPPPSLKETLLFGLKPLLKDGNLQPYSNKCMPKKETQEPPEHTSEYVKSQNFMGDAPRPPSHNPYCRLHFLVLVLGPLILFTALGHLQPVISTCRFSSSLFLITNLQFEPLLLFCYSVLSFMFFVLRPHEQSI